MTHKRRKPTRLPLAIMSVLLMIAFLAACSGSTTAGGGDQAAGGGEAAASDAAGGEAAPSAEASVDLNAAAGSRRRSRHRCRT